jgi:DNA-binding NarL/FixJ family response regulator
LGHLSSADRLVETVNRVYPDIILLDVDMPGADPLEIARDLTERNPAVRVIVFSGHLSSDLIERAARSGAWGYISKGDGEGALLEGIHCVCAGGFALSPEAIAVLEHFSQSNNGAGFINSKSSVSEGAVGSRQSPGGPHATFQCVQVPTR